jgi:hypothetical protein
LYFDTKFITVLAKAVLFASVATAEENHREPVQPPTEIMALTFWDFVRGGGREIGGRHTFSWAVCTNWGSNPPSEPERSRALTSGVVSLGKDG